MRKTISFTEYYEAEYKHLCGKKNASEYVCELIKKDRCDNKDNLEERIITLLNQIVQGRKIQSPNTHTSDRKEKALKSIFNM